MRSKLEDPTQARRVRSSLIGCENKDLVKTGFRSRSIFERTAKYWYTVFFYCFDKLRNLFSALKWQSKISYRESVSSHLSQSESNQLKEMSKGSFLNWVSLFLNCPGHPPKVLDKFQKHGQIPNFEDRAPRKS